MDTSLIPLLHPGHGGPPPFLGGLVLLLLTALAVAVVVQLARRGRLGAPPAFFRSPEHDARVTLANRFANGDISTDEFLERASVLNWTPGVDDRSTDQKQQRKR
ncbi:SHOCT domain-containing protein [Auraticoccus sp. F435]|uniref:SHOCT domain-containing protein n=1 Tax=Auraticoccus cholistanensis TaxID=2656650 RepID=A0A6A9UUL7_9ACTN|nr:SHOCT domain-containing protein [Auraticoccus cholistanensis]MVA75435.1 SHOCT domain-containing protein [Auraticoccus cholistanensis]